MRISLLSLAAAALVLSVTSLSWAIEPSCPAQLDESQTHAALLAQSRDQAEQRLAQAIRANREISAMHQKLVEQHKKVADELAALTAKAAESSKP